MTATEPNVSGKDRRDMGLPGGVLNGVDCVDAEVLAAAPHAVAATPRVEAEEFARQCLPVRPYIRP